VYAEDRTQNYDHALSFVIIYRKENDMTGRMVYTVQGGPKTVPLF